MSAYAQLILRWMDIIYGVAKLPLAGGYRYIGGFLFIGVTCGRKFFNASLSASVGAG
jgi:hypothetical protein